MKVRSTKLALSAGLALSLLGLAPAAQAVEVPEGDRIMVTNITAIEQTAGERVDLILWELREGGSRTPSAGGSWGLQVTSCGSFVKDGVGTWDGSADYVMLDFNTDEEQLIGKSVEYTFTFTEPGYDPYTLSSSYSAFSTSRPACSEIGTSGASGVVVNQWSVKKGAALVGKTASVTATKAPGATVSYSWKVGSKVVDRDRRVEIMETYRGKPLLIVVKVSKVGAKSRAKVLRYGRVR